MGWLWSSSASTPTNSQSETSSPSTPNAPSSALAEPCPVPSSTTEPLPVTSRRARAPTRDELAERELQSFLQELSGESQPKPKSQPKFQRLPRAEHGEERTRKGEAGLTLEEQLLPTDMSCREAFDSAFYCQSMGGQFNNLYRYGGVKSCSEHWSSFWFCMRMKGYKDEERAGRFHCPIIPIPNFPFGMDSAELQVSRSANTEVSVDMIRDHYKKRALKYKVGPSSEDVWESREGMMEWGEAFSEPMDADLDEDMKRREQLRRQGKVEGTI
jgi:hypothetical protein